MTVAIYAKITNILYDPYHISGKLGFTINWQPSNVSFQAGVNAQGIIDTVADEGNGVFETIEDAIEYHKDAKLTELVDSLNNGDIGNFITFTEGGFANVDEAVAQELDAAITPLEAALTAMESSVAPNGTVINLQIWGY